KEKGKNGNYSNFFNYYRVNCTIGLFYYPLDCKRTCASRKYVRVYDLFRDELGFSVHYHLFYLQIKYSRFICIADCINYYCVCKYVSKRTIAISTLITKPMVIYPCHNGFTFTRNSRG